MVRASKRIGSISLAASKRLGRSQWGGLSFEDGRERGGGVWELHHRSVVPETVDSDTTSSGVSNNRLDRVPIHLQYRYTESIQEVP